MLSVIQNFILCALQNIFLCILKSLGILCKLLQNHTEEKHDVENATTMGSVSYRRLLDSCTGNPYNHTFIEKNVIVLWSILTMY